MELANFANNVISPIEHYHLSFNCVRLQAHSEKGISNGNSKAVYLVA